MAPIASGTGAFDALNVWSEKKRREKLNSARGNAAKEGASQLSLLVTCHSSLAAALFYSDFWLLSSDS